MLLGLFMLFLSALLSVAASEDEGGSKLTLDQSVTATFEFRGKLLRIWATKGNEERSGSSLRERRFFYEPALVPFLITDNQIFVISYTVPSFDVVDMHKVTLFISTSSTEVQDLALKALAMTLGKETGIRKVNLQPLPLLKINMTLSGLIELFSDSNKQRCFKKTFEKPKPIVELTLTADCDKKAKHIAKLLENGHISYSMEVDPEIMLEGHRKLGDSGLLKGKINLREYNLLQQVRVLSEEYSIMKEQLQKKLKVKEGDFVNAQKENTDLKQQLKKTIEMKEEELKNVLYDLQNVQKENTDLKELLQNATAVNEKRPIDKQEENEDLPIKEEECKNTNETGQLEEQLKKISKRFCSPGWTIMCFLCSCPCYRIFDTEDKSWEKASQSCRSFGSELVSIHSDEENAFLVEQTKMITSKWSPWIGLNDRSQQGLFQWSDGTLLEFTSWSSVHNGVNGNAKHDCGLIRRIGYKWEVWNCLSEQPYICKKRL